MYPSDLTGAQWLQLELLLKLARGDRHGGGRPRKSELGWIVDAMLSVVKIGCQWRQLPVNFSPWRSIYQQFYIWRDNGVWERVGRTLRQQGHKTKGQNAMPSGAIIDSQSPTTALKRAARLRCVQEDQGPQAPHHGRHGKQSAGRHCAFGWHLGPRGRPRSAHAPVLSLRLEREGLRRW